MTKKDAISIGSLIEQLKAAGLPEEDSFYGFSQGFGFCFWDADGLEEEKAPAYITAKGYVMVDWHGDGFRRYGQAVMKQYGWG